MRLTNVVFRRTLSEIKLNRTDTTTLDLSQNGKESWRRKKKVQNGDKLGGVVRATLDVLAPFPSLFSES